VGTYDTEITSLKKSLLAKRASLDRLAPASAGAKKLGAEVAVLTSGVAKVVARRAKAKGESSPVWFTCLSKTFSSVSFASVFSCLRVLDGLLALTPSSLPTLAHFLLLPFTYLRGSKYLPLVCGGARIHTHVHPAHLPPPPHTYSQSHSRPCAHVVQCPPVVSAFVFWCTHCHVPSLTSIAYAPVLVVVVRVSFVSADELDKAIAGLQASFELHEDDVRALARENQYFLLENRSQMYYPPGETIVCAVNEMTFRVPPAAFSELIATNHLGWILTVWLKTGTVRWQVPKGTLFIEGYAHAKCQVHFESPISLSDLGKIMVQPIGAVAPKFFS
jgi:hypothetical protein